MPANNELKNSKSYYACPGSIHHHPLFPGAANSKSPCARSGSIHAHRPLSLCAKIPSRSARVQGASITTTFHPVSPSHPCLVITWSVHVIGRYISSVFCRLPSSPADEEGRRECVVRTRRSTATRLLCYWGDGNSSVMLLGQRELLCNATGRMEGCCFFLFSLWEGVGGWVWTRKAT